MSRTSSSNFPGNFAFVVARWLVLFLPLALVVVRDIALGLNNLAVLLQAENKLAEAEPLYHEAIEILRASRPAGHPDIATSLSDLASLLQDQDKPAEAEPLFREALAIYRKSGCDDRAACVTGEAGAGRACVARGTAGQNANAPAGRPGRSL